MAAQVTTPGNDLWIIFGAKQMDAFDRDNIAFCNCLVLGDGLRKSMNEVYRAIIKHGLAPKIEELPQHEKEVLWLRANDIAGKNFLNKEQMIELSKALYVIECFQKK
jgi:hypothetical protein